MKYEQQTLFEELEVEVESKSEVIIVDLKISENEEKSTKQQKKLFNSRMKGIQKLRDDISQFGKISLELMDIYQKKVSIHEIGVDECRLKLLESLDNAYQKKSFSEAEKDFLVGEILDHVRILREGLQEYDELNKYDKYFEMVSNQMLQNEETANIMRGMMEGMMGMDGVDPKDFVGDDKLSEEELKDKYFSEDQNFSGQQKSKNKDNEVVENNFRKKYKQLAKRIHPDLETDLKNKEKKEALMKELVIAKENKDLFQLISLQAKIDYLEYGETRVDEINLEQTNKYLLKQKKELEIELFKLKNHSGISSWLYQTFYHPTPKGTKRRMLEYLNELENNRTSLEEAVNEFRTVKSTKEFIRNQNDEMDFSDMFFY